MARKCTVIFVSETLSDVFVRPGFGGVSKNKFGESSAEKNVEKLCFFLWKIAFSLCPPSVFCRWMWQCSVNPKDIARQLAVWDTAILLSSKECIKWQKFVSGRQILSMHYLRLQQSSENVQCIYLERAFRSSQAYFKELGVYIFPVHSAVFVTVYYMQTSMIQCPWLTFTDSTRQDWGINCGSKRVSVFDHSSSAESTWKMGNFRT